MMTFLAVIHIIACLGLIVLVLLQDSKGGGVFTSQATSNSVLGAGGATSLAQTMTKVLAALFALTCIGLSILSARNEKSVIDSSPSATTQQVPTTQTPPTEPATPGTPTTPKTPTPPIQPPATAPAETK
jgi:preprotein translocase subunit SecG